MTDDDSGVRGREEILIEIERELQNRIGGIKAVNSVIKGSEEAGRVRGLEEAVEVIQGVRDEL